MFLMSFLLKILSCVTIKSSRTLIKVYLTFLMHMHSLLERPFSSNSYRTYTFVILFQVLTPPLKIRKLQKVIITSLRKSSQFFVSTLVTRNNLFRLNTEIIKYIILRCSLSKYQFQGQSSRKITQPCL